MRDVVIKHVVAVDKNFCIGRGNALAWDVPSDMRHFREITKGGVVVMGRKTFESIGRPLPNRENWVLTSNCAFSHEGINTCDSLKGAIQHIRNAATEDTVIYVIGGAEVYNKSLSIADSLIITHLDLEVENGDAFYPAIPERFRKISSTHAVCEQSKVKMEFATYQA